MSVDFKETTRLCIPKGSNRHTRRHQGVESHKMAKKTKRQRKFPLVLYACFWNVGTTFWGKWSYLEEQRETQEDLGDSCRSHVEVQDARRTAQWEARHATESHSTSVDNRRFRGVQYSNKKMYVKVSQQLPFIMINKIINIVSTVSASLVIMWCQ